MEVAMINILLDALDFSADFLYEELKRYIHPEDKVVILAFSYRDRDVRCLADWNRLYGKSGGLYYEGGISFLPIRDSGGPYSVD